METLSGIIRSNPLYDEVARVFTNCFVLSVRNEEKQLDYSEFNVYRCSAEGNFVPRTFANVWR